MKAFAMIGRIKKFATGFALTRITCNILVKGNSC